MELAEFLDQRSVAVDLQATDKPSALAALVELASRSVSFEGTSEIVDALMEREALVSTGIGHSIAVPHCKTPQADQLLIAVGRFKEPIDFGSVDGSPVSLFFLLIAPKSAANSHLKALGKIARFAKDPAIREGLLKCEGSEGLFEYILEQDKQVS